LLPVETAFSLAMAFAPVLSVRQRSQLRIPVRLERVRYHAVVRIHLHIASPRELDVILCVLHFLAAEPIGFVDPRLELLLDGERHLERYRSDGLDEQFADRVIDAAAVDDLATWLTACDPAELTEIGRHVASIDLVIAHRHALAADGADCEALQERRAFARRAFLPVSSVRVSVIAQTSVVLVELREGDVTRMRVGNVGGPFLAR